MKITTSNTPQQVDYKKLKLSSESFAAEVKKQTPTVYHDFGYITKMKRKQFMDRVALLDLRGNIPALKVLGNLGLSYEERLELITALTSCNSLKSGL